MFIPQNEQGVVYLFGQLAHEGGFELISIGTAFPDAVVKKGGIEYRVEFEYLASNFIAHKHDPRRCDVVICWRNDFEGPMLPIIALEDESWREQEIVQPTELEREAIYWRYRALEGERRARYYKDELEKLNWSKSGKLEEQGECRCDGCGRTFGSPQAVGAHSRYCRGRPTIESISGSAQMYNY